jgi:hypothetical protein
MIPNTPRNTKLDLLTETMQHRSQWLLQQKLPLVTFVEDGQPQDQSEGIPCSYKKREQWREPPHVLLEINTSISTNSPVRKNKKAEYIPNIVVYPNWNTTSINIIIIGISYELLPKRYAVQSLVYASVELYLFKLSTTIYRYRYDVNVPFQRIKEIQL